MDPNNATPAVEDPARPRSEAQEGLQEPPGPAQETSHVQKSKTVRGDLQAGEPGAWIGSDDTGWWKPSAEGSASGIVLCKEGWWRATAFCGRCIEMPKATHTSLSARDWVDMILWNERAPEPPKAPLDPPKGLYDWYVDRYDIWQRRGTSGELLCTARKISGAWWGAIAGEAGYGEATFQGELDYVKEQLDRKLVELKLLHPNDAFREAPKEPGPWVRREDGVATRSIGEAVLAMVWTEWWDDGLGQQDQVYLWRAMLGERDSGMQQGDSIEDAKKRADRFIERRIAPHRPLKRPSFEPKPKSRPEPEAPKAPTAWVWILDGFGTWHSDLTVGHYNYRVQIRSQPENPCGNRLLVLVGTNYSEAFDMPFGCEHYRLQNHAKTLIRRHLIAMLGACA